MASNQIVDPKSSISKTNANNPIIGNIYLLRYSVPKAFSIDVEEASPSSFSCSASSTTSSTSKSSTGKAKSERFYGRPCVVLYTEERSTTVLLITQFHGENPASDKLGDNIVLPEISRNELMKHLLSIQPAEGVAGRRSVKLKSSPISKYFKSNKTSYIVLKPVTVPIKEKWRKPLEDSISTDELLFINEVLTELQQEKRELIKNSEQTIGSIMHQENVDDDDDDIETTSSYMNVPTSRCIAEPIGKEIINKSSQVQRWLDESSSCFNIIQEDIDAYL